MFDRDGTRACPVYKGETHRYRLYLHARKERDLDTYYKRLLRNHPLLNITLKERASAQRQEFLLTATHAEMCMLTKNLPEDIWEAWEEI